MAAQSIQSIHLERTKKMDSIMQRRFSDTDIDMDMDFARAHKRVYR